MSITRYRVFRDIAQTRSISQAAELNSISQSAASQTLKALEKHVGVVLVDRRTRPLKLTPAGRIYLDGSRDIVRRHDEMQVQLQALEQRVNGGVRVASIYSIGLYELTQLKDRFQALHPRARVHLDFMRPDRIYEALLEDRADIGLVSYPTATKGLKAVPWRTEQMVLVCHPDHPLAAQVSIRPADLARADFISFDRGLSIRRALDRFFREHGVQRGVALEFDNIQMIKEALSINQGVSILPERTVQQETREGRLVARPVDAKGLVRPVGVVLNSKKVLSPTAEEFLKFLRATPREAAA